MALLKKYNQEAVEVGSVEVSEELYNTPYHPYLIKNSVVAFLASQHQGTHKVKGRSEVAGSTRKLYKQKGTGNARAGSVRSPLRRHGGTVFGPVPRSYDKKVNKKERKTAFKSVLAFLMKENRLILVDSLEFSSHKTKDAASFFSNWPAKNYLAVTEIDAINFILGARNLPNVKLSDTGGVNIFDMLKYDKVLMTEDSFKIIERRFI